SWSLAVEAGRPRADAVLAHQSLYPAPAHDLTALLQGRVDSRAAIGFAAVGMRRSDLVHEAGVLNRALARWPVHPGVVARGADPEHPAQIGRASCRERVEDPEVAGPSTRHDVGSWA